MARQQNTSGTQKTDAAVGAPGHAHMRLPVSEDNSSRHWCDEPNEDSQNCSAAHLSHALQLLSLHGHARQAAHLDKQNKLPLQDECACRGLHPDGCIAVFQQARAAQWRSQPSATSRGHVGLHMLTQAACCKTSKEERVCLRWGEDRDAPGQECGPRLLSGADR